MWNRCFVKLPAGEATRKASTMSSTTAPVRAMTLFLYEFLDELAEDISISIDWYCSSSLGGYGYLYMYLELDSVPLILDVQIMEIIVAIYHCTHHHHIRRALIRIQYMKFNRFLYYFLVYFTSKLLQKSMPSKPTYGLECWMHMHIGKAFMWFRRGKINTISFFMNFWDY